MNGDVGPDMMGLIQVTLTGSRPTTDRRTGNLVWEHTFRCAAGAVPLCDETIRVVVKPATGNITTFYGVGTSGVDGRSFDQERWHCEENGGDRGHI